MAGNEKQEKSPPMTGAERQRKRRKRAKSNNFVANHPGLSRMDPESKNRAISRIDTEISAITKRHLKEIADALGMSMKEALQVIIEARYELLMKSKRQ